MCARVSESLRGGRLRAVESFQDLQSESCVVNEQRIRMDVFAGVECIFEADINHQINKSISRHSIDMIVIDFIGH